MYYIERFIVKDEQIKGQDKQICVFVKQGDFFFIIHCLLTTFAFDIV